MGNQDFYGERKWCEQCKDYVRYLMSVDHSFCVQCSTKVRLFSSDDARKFSETVQRHRWQASRTRVLAGEPCSPTRSSG